MLKLNRQVRIIHLLICVQMLPKPSPHAENKPTAKKRKDYEPVDSACAGCPKGEFLYTLGVQEYFSCIHFKRFASGF